MMAESLGSSAILDGFLGLMLRVRRLWPLMAAVNEAVVFVTDR
jgi:hypothetical protein